MTASPGAPPELTTLRITFLAKDTGGTVPAVVVARGPVPGGPGAPGPPVASPAPPVKESLSKGPGTAVARGAAGPGKR